MKPILNAKVVGPTLEFVRSRRGMFWLGAVVVALGALVLWQVYAAPSSPWILKWQLTRYLKKQSHKKDFSVPFRFPSHAQMAHAPAETSTNHGAPAVGELTRKSFDALRTEYLKLKLEALGVERNLAERQIELARLEAQPRFQATNRARPLANTNFTGRLARVREQVAGLGRALSDKETALAPIVSDLWAYQRVWALRSQTEASSGSGELAAAWSDLNAELRQELDQASTYEEMYWLIGQELWVADRLLASANPQHRRVALNIARQAASDALHHSENGWVAARIVEVYIWPNLDLVDTAGGTGLNFENLVAECADVFRRNDEPHSVVRSFELVLAKATTPQRSDWARVQMAMAHEQIAQFTEAVQDLRQVKNTNTYVWAVRRIPGLERRAKQP